MSSQVRAQLDASQGQQLHISLSISHVLPLISLQLQELHIYLATDGFEVSDEEYFHSLPAQTLFIVAGPDAVITTGECD